VSQPGARFFARFRKNDRHKDMTKPPVSLKSLLDGQKKYISLPRSINLKQKKAMLL
jgi:hypothetical protein